MGSSDAWKALMCKSNKQNLLGTIHSGPIEYCDISPIYICGGEEITGANARADFETCLANDKNAICTSALNADAVKRPDGGPWVSPIPSDMRPPIGKDCGETYWYCQGKIHREPDSQTKYANDPNCQKKCVLRNKTLCNIYKTDYWCCGG